MNVVNYSELRLDLKRYLDIAENDNELVVIKRSKGSGAVLISLDEYNSLIETSYLLGSEKNAKWLYESIQQVKNGNIIQRELKD